MNPMKEQRWERGGRSRSTRANGVWRMSIDLAGTADQPGWGPQLRALGDLSFSMREWKPAFEILADKMAQASAKAFSTGTGPDGYKWKPLGMDYAERKSTRAMLYGTGRLQSIATNPSKAVETLTNTRMVYEIDLPYATTHQFGSSPKPQTGFGGARVRNYLVYGYRGDAKASLIKLFYKTLNEYGASRRDRILRRLAA